MLVFFFFFFFSSRRRHTRYWRDWSSDVCSSDLHKWHMPNALCMQLQNVAETGTMPHSETSAMPWRVLAHRALHLLGQEGRHGERGDSRSLRLQVVQDDVEVPAPDLRTDRSAELSRLGEGEDEERYVGCR